MNYVAHTRAAHEHLSRQAQARPHHVSLYWTLFYQWNAARFPLELPLNRADVMQAAHIGNRGTYLDTLRDLAAWGLLTYQPSHNGGSSVRLRTLGEVVPEMGHPAGSCTRSGLTEIPSVVPEVVQPLARKWANQPGRVVPEVGQPSLYGKTGSTTNGVNSAAAPHQKKIAVLEGEGLSGAELLPDDTAPAQPMVSEANGAGPVPGAAPKKKVAPKKKGVKQAKTIRAAAAGSDSQTRRGRQQQPEVPFAESELADVEKFIQAFDDTDYQLADLRFYHAKIQAWRDRKTGEPPQRRDWKACATQFFLNDAHENRLKLAPNVQRRPDGSLHQQPPAGDFFAAAGFKSKYDR
ncbi:hypothetical protein [Hymenobacter psychrophilus]|uniref:Uncharacterized protein n=1 Tax=Hymenobacter psychrophilus TaxID=651662 RepID=A0A1H3KZ42_9BACT|nr:hypothetical protein [Hymenobacter psychrophilus]SDY56988.1 hypothetical protein SAMN04488069_11015 [Hymenobacter psychrophilus]